MAEPDSDAGGDFASDSGSVGAHRQISLQQWSDRVWVELDEAWEAGGDIAQNASDERVLNNSLYETEAWRALRFAECRGELCRVELKADDAALEALERRVDELGYDIYPRDTRVEPDGFVQELFLARRTFVVGQRIAERVAREQGGSPPANW